MWIRTFTTDKSHNYSTITKSEQVKLKLTEGYPTDTYKAC